MPSLLTPLPDVAYPHELDRLTVAATAPTRVSIEVDYIPLLDVWLTPANGRIELHSLFPLIADALQPMGLCTAPFVMKLDGSQCAWVTLYPCRGRLNHTATEVLGRYFLQAAPACLRTFAPGAPVCLTWAAVDEREDPLQVTTLWSDRASTTVRSTVTTFAPVTPDADGAFRTVRFGLGQLKRPDDLHTWVPARLVVACGARRLTLLAAPSGEACAPVTVVEYRNLFGADDTFALLGSCVEEEKNSYLSAPIGGRLRTLMVTPEPLTKGRTGALLEGDIVCLRDLARSPAVSIGGQPVVITGLDLKRDTAHHATAEATLQWSPAVKERHVTRAAGGVFDDTFDTTFE